MLLGRVRGRLALINVGALSQGRGREGLKPRSLRIRLMGERFSLTSGAGDNCFIKVSMLVAHGEPSIGMSSSGVLRIVEKLTVFYVRRVGSLKYWTGLRPRRIACADDLV